MRQVLETSGLRPDAYVYVKRMARWGWADEDSLEINGNVEDHLERLREEVAALLAAEARPALGLWEEVIRYHGTYRPHKQADFVFLRSDA